jgi:dTDP-4-amino-4,6-dideoxygalactose transaminase
MKIPFFELKSQYESIKPEIDAAVKDVFTDSIYTLGPRVEAFETAFAGYCGVHHCIGLNSGTAALALLMQAHCIGKDDEVITVANTFFSTAQAISEIGAVPVLVDCEEATALINPTLVEAAITTKTKAIIAVHLYGQCADMDALSAIAKAKGILLFEDACQAHGATYKGKKAGNLANGAAFSFYPTKNLGSYGEGGCVTTNNAQIAEKIRMLRNNGAATKYVHDMVGWNERMHAMQGAVLLAKLAHLDKWNAERRRLARVYRSFLPSTVKPLMERGDGEHVYHLFVARMKDRDSVKAKLAEKDIETMIHYPVPIHLQKAYEGRWKAGDFPVSESLATDMLSLPLYPELPEEQVRRICDMLAEITA